MYVDYILSILTDVLDEANIYLVLYCLMFSIPDRVNKGIA